MEARDLTALAADDAAVEAEIERAGGNALRLGLHAYAFGGEFVPVDFEEERRNRLALVYCLPVAVVAVLIIFLAWGA